MCVHSQGPMISPSWVWTMPSSLHHLQGARKARIAVSRANPTCEVRSRSASSCFTRISPSRAMGTVIVFGLATVVSVAMCGYPLLLHHVIGDEDEPTSEPVDPALNPVEEVGEATQDVNHRSPHRRRSVRKADRFARKLSLQGSGNMV